MTAQPTFSPAPQDHAPAQPKQKRKGLILGLLSTPLVLAAIGAVALFLFGPKTVEPESVQNEIGRIIQTAVQVAPADVSCPDGIKAQAGGTFTCTGTVEGQPMTFWVQQNDDKGNLTITYDRLLRLDAVEQSIAGQVSSDIEIDVLADCGPADRTVIVNAPGQPIDCTVTNASDPTDGAQTTVTVDAEGNAEYQFV
jgi:hypothetical protein